MSRNLKQRHSANYFPGSTRKKLDPANPALNEPNTPKPSSNFYDPLWNWMEFSRPMLLPMPSSRANRSGAGLTGRKEPLLRYCHFHVMFVWNWRKSFSFGGRLFATEHNTLGTEDDRAPKAARRKIDGFNWKKIKLDFKNSSPRCGFSPCVSFVGVWGKKKGNFFDGKA